VGKNPLTLSISLGFVKLFSLAGEIFFIGQKSSGLTYVIP
jgi:hypothetical protein